MTEQDTAPADRRGPGRPREDSERLQFRVTGRMAEWLDARSRLSLNPGPDLQAKADLTLLRDILETELRGIRLTIEQALCVTEVLNGTVLEPFIGTPFGIAYTNAYDAFQDGRRGPVRGVSTYGAKYGHAEDWEEWEDTLLAYLQQLTPTQDYTLRCAIARWWQLPGDDVGADEAEIARFRSVGLMVVEG